MTADNRKGIGYILLGNTIFGLSFLFSKQALATTPFLALLMWRFVLAFGAMSLLWAVGALRMSFKGKPIWKLVPLVLFQPVLYFVFESLGLQRTSSSVAGIMISTVPVVVYVLAGIFLKERLSKGQLLGALVSIAGVVMIVLLDGFQPEADWIGILCMLMAVLVGGSYNVMVRGVSREFSAVEITYLMMAAGALCFTGAALVDFLPGGNIGQLVEPFGRSEFLVAVVYLGILSSVVAYFATNRAVALLGAGRTSAFANLTTVISMVAGVVVLGERLELYHLVGAAMILTGVWWAEHSGQRQQHLAEGGEGRHAA